jgi:hypothetical protein
MSASQKTSDRLGRLEAVVGEIDLMLQTLHSIVVNTEWKNGDAPVENKPAMRDKVWACDNCSARLGIYNEERDELRVRYKDFVAYVTPGVGGKIMVPCRRCGCKNLLQDTRQL